VTAVSMGYFSPVAARLLVAACTERVRGRERRLAMENFPDGGAGQQGARAADGGAGALGEAGATTVTPPVRGTRVPRVPAPSYPPSGGLAAAAGGGTGTVTGPAGSGLDVPPSSGPSGPADARVPVPPSQPRPPRSGRWPLLSHFAYGPLPEVWGASLPVCAGCWTLTRTVVTYRRPGLVVHDRRPPARSDTCGAGAR
jgi:hypothetical protein